MNYGDQLETMRISRDGAVATVTLTRPAEMNRFDVPQHAEFVEVLKYLRRAEAGIRVVILAAEGKHFSAGGDVGTVRQMADDFRARAKAVSEGLELMNELLSFPLPIVTAIQGAAMGLGANVAFATDIVVAWRQAKLADPHVKIGLVAGDGGAVVWPISAGILRAKRHLLTGEAMTAEEGYAFGLVTDLVDNPEDVLPRAQELAGKVASLPPLAVQGTKAALNRLLGQRAGEVLELSLQLEGMTMASRDVVEAATAFIEKRPGIYTGT
ncbi:enoyl-CoA hydratase/isomerase family protein [Rhodococcus qingshengii]|uniref:enoyl-CoA hydratase/isomerase family protein n=1 Tax=Rhodococcus qingshengii TaxID=334542 RepID=UPI001B3BAFB4|nr:enoyl-CoA hydratase-related protein [Rhodococcus qingshengii]